MFHLRLFRGENGDEPRLLLFNAQILIFLDKLSHEVIEDDLPKEKNELLKIGK